MKDWTCWEILQRGMRQTGNKGGFDVQGLLFYGLFSMKWCTAKNFY